MRFDCAADTVMAKRHASFARAPGSRFRTAHPRRSCLNSSPTKRARPACRCRFDDALGGATDGSPREREWPHGLCPCLQSHPAFDHRDTQSYFCLHVSPSGPTATEPHKEFAAHRPISIDPFARAPSVRPASAHLTVVAAPPPATAGFSAISSGACSRGEAGPMLPIGRNGRSYSKPPTVRPPLSSLVCNLPAALPASGALTREEVPSCLLELSIFFSWS